MPTFPGLRDNIREVVSNFPDWIWPVLAVLLITNLVLNHGGEKPKRHSKRGDDEDD